MELEELVNEYIIENRYTFSFNDVLEEFKMLSAGCYISHSFKKVVMKFHDDLMEYTNNAK